MALAASRVIRPGCPGDLSFVRATLFESSKDSAIAHSVGPGLYARRWRPLVDALVGRYRLDVWADDELPDVILGWLLHDNVDTVIYLFVREDFRRQGIARQLLATLPRVTTYAFRTTSWQQASSRLAPTLHFDPTVAWRHFGA